MMEVISHIRGYPYPVYKCDRCTIYTHRAAFTDDGDTYCYGCVDEGDWPKNSIYIHTHIDCIEIEDLTNESAHETVLSYSIVYPEITANILAELALFTKSKL